MMRNRVVICLCVTFVMETFTCIAAFSENYRTHFQYQEKPYTQTRSCINCAPPLPNRIEYTALELRLSRS